MSKLCKHCKDCCCSHDNGGTFITLHEALRIAKALNISVDDVCEFIEDKDLEENNDFKNYYNMYIDNNGKILPFCYKKHILIIKKNGRDCKFLSNNGCTIKNLRPTYCHVFPFWLRVTEKGIIIFPMSSYSKENETCLVRKKHFHETDFTIMLKEIGETKESLLKILTKFIEEVKIYQSYAPELLKGKSPSEIAKGFSLEKDL